MIYIGVLNYILKSRLRLINQTINRREKCSNDNNNIILARQQQQQNMENILTGIYI